MPEQYIFKGDAAAKIFYEKLEKLHDKYVYHLLLSGSAPLGTNIELIKMTKNPVAGKDYCERVIGGLTNLKPDIIAKSQETNSIVECFFTKIDDKESLNHVYMIQNVINWPRTDVFSCQVWYLGETTIEQIKEHWSG